MHAGCIYKAGMLWGVRRASRTAEQICPGATAALRDGMRQRRRREWLTPFASSLTRQTARKAPSNRVTVKSGAHGVALLRIVVPATPSVARLIIILILTVTRSAEIVQRSLRIVRKPYSAVLWRDETVPPCREF